MSQAESNVIYARGHNFEDCKGIRLLNGEPREREFLYMVCANRKKSKYMIKFGRSYKPYNRLKNHIKNFRDYAGIRPSYQKIGVIPISVPLHLEQDLINGFSFLFPDKIADQRGEYFEMHGGFWANSAISYFNNCSRQLAQHGNLYFDSLVVKGLGWVE